MGELTLVVGGQKSGKSSTAVRLATETGAPVVVLAPAARTDAEMIERIDRHQQDRPGGWKTVETFDLAAALGQADPEACVIIDALDTWLAHAMSEAGLWADADVAAWGDEGTRAAEQLLATVGTLAGTAQRRDGATIVVAGQPGFGLHALSANGRRYTDLHGLALQRLGVGGRVVMVVAGRAVELP